MPQIRAGHSVRLCLGLALSLFAAAPVFAQTSRAAPEAPTATQDNSATAKKFMVATAHPLATRAGLEVLRRGGNALDAAIAVQMVLNVVEPQSSGIGGGAFLLYWDADARRLTSYDGRETAPAAASPGRFVTADGTPMPWPAAVGTGLSVGVPGLLAMLDMTHKAYGKLPWGDLFNPAVHLARDGFGVSPRLSSSLAGMGADAFAPSARAFFFDARGEPWPLGHVLKNSDLADTFETIARDGIASFYSGPIGADILAALAAMPGPKSEMMPEDLAGYRAKARAPVCAPYRDRSVCGMGPPSSGGLTIAQILMLLDGLDLGTRPTPDAAHLIVEAEKLAYADRNRFMADADFVAVPDGLLNPDYIARRRRLIAADRVMPRAVPGEPPSRRAALNGRDATHEAPGTSHISIVDGDGNAVSLTTSVEAAFGARVMVRGFLLNNQLTDFAFQPVDETGVPLANRVEGGKRPRSSMAPTMVFDRNGRLESVLGSPGGSRIILYVAKALVAMIDWGMDPQTAAALPAFGSRNGPAEIEAGAAAEALAAALKAHGHEVTRPAMTSGLHVVTRTATGLAGGADPRREGAAGGE